MALPSRVYVGVFVFGLIASIVTLTYTALFLSGYRPPPEPPLIYFEPPDEPAKQFFLVLSSLLCVGFTVFAWRRLVAGARRDVETRRRRAELAREQQRYRRTEQENKRPPGYT